MVLLDFILEVDFLFIRFVSMPWSSKSVPPLAFRPLYVHPASWNQSPLAFRPLYVHPASWKTLVYTFIYVKRFGFIITLLHCIVMRCTLS